jgi:hypothetical protein
MITINRDNYDTWLMLYLDNELSATERAAVEAFAGMHPDVQEELNGLKETILQPDVPAVMPGIERLLMPGLWDEEALTGQQEKLLMLADNELSPNEKQEFATVIESNPLLQKEWSLLQKTIAQEVQVAEMPGKERLYHRQSSRVIPISRILRFAAAAAILGFGWFYVSNMTTDVPAENNGQVAVVNPQNVPDTSGGKNYPEAITGTEKNTENTNETIAAVEAPDTEGDKITIESPVQRSKSAQKDVTLSREALAVNIPEALLQKTQQDMAVMIPATNFVDVAGVEDPAEPVLTKPVAIEVAAYVVPEQTITDYELIDANDLGEDETISIAGARINKQKVRNVYRNITRPIARSLEKNNILK